MPSIENLAFRSTIGNSDRESSQLLCIYNVDEGFLSIVALGFQKFLYTFTVFATAFDC